MITALWLLADAQVSHAIDYSSGTRCGTWRSEEFEPTGHWP
jgi:hypothetical protein